MRNTSFHESLGGYKYQTVMSLSQNQPVILCGNSSSIIKEAPFYGTNALIIGSRQNGRETADNIINCDVNRKLILSNLKKLSKSNLKVTYNPYYKKNVSETIVKFILSIFENNSKENIK